MEARNSSDISALPTESLTGPHWDFAVSLYKMPGVSEACLTLQDECGVDVNVLLIALYANKRKSQAITRGWLETADSAVSRIRGDVVLPLRQTRRAMKASAMSLDIARDIREEVKRLEIRAERYEQAVLANLLPTEGSQPQGLHTVIEMIVSFYRERHSIKNHREIAGEMKLIESAIYTMPNR